MFTFTTHASPPLRLQLCRNRSQAGTSSLPLSSELPTRREIQVNVRLTADEMTASDRGVITFLKPLSVSHYA